MDLPEIPEVVGTPSMVLVKGVLSALLPPLELIGAFMINPQAFVVLGTCV